MSNQALIRKTPEDDGFIVTLEDAFRIGDVVAKSKLFPEVTDQARAVVAILAGRELGIPPMASLRNIHVIKGKVELSSGLLAAMIQKSEKYSYKVLQSTDDLCDLEWFEFGQSVGRSHFTIADARRAKLIKPESNWEKFPRAMLFARALTEGQKKYCPEIGIGPVYAPGEIAETDVIDITPQTVSDFPTAREIFDDPDPRLTPHTPLPSAWTDDSAARQLADQEIANKINAGLKTIAEEITAEAPEPTQTTTERIAEAREKNIKPALTPILTVEGNQSPPAPYLDDPVPALKPTLTPAQQKVSDAVTSLLKEHERTKAETLLVIEKLAGRPVKASKDLSDAEAERVFAHLQNLAAQYLENAKPEPTKPAYNQKTRAHGEQIGHAIDLAIKRLTILNVPFGPVSDSIAELVEREFGRRIANRYEMNDEEAQSALEYLQTRILERESEIEQKEAEARADAVKAGEV
jgi:hypothetical protein